LGGQSVFGLAVQASVGGAASRLIVTLAVVVPPGDVAVQVKVTPGVSAVTIACSQPLVLTGDSESLTDQKIATVDVYQPFRPSVPATVGVIVGGVESIGIKSIVPYTSALSLVLPLALDAVLPEKRIGLPATTRAPSMTKIAPPLP